MTNTLIAISLVGSLADALSFHGLFTGGAVLQQDIEVAVYGTSQGKTVNLMLDGKLLTTAPVSTEGSWLAYLPAQSTAWSRTLRAEDGLETAEVPVSFGHVVLCSGQSNMGMPVYSKDPSGFAAANGSAEAATADRYTGKIWLASVQGKAPKSAWNGTGCNSNAPPSCVNNLTWNRVTPENLPGWSAVCWYAGKSLFERLGGHVPVGLMRAAVGGSPIEFWLPPGHVNNSICGVDDPPCDAKKYHDSDFYNTFIDPLAPYTIGAVVWDQGERDVHCYAPATNHTAQYPCLEHELIKSWRANFNSSFVFVAVQLPGYIGDCDAPGANPNSTYYNCVPGVYEMRLAQEMGTAGDDRATVVASYDLGCPFGVKTDECPHGSVHPVFKAPVGERIGAELLRLLGGDISVTEGPRADAATTAPGRAGETKVTVHFSGGTAPFQLRGTMHCGACCANGIGDFDASADGGVTWSNATGPHALAGDRQILFNVALPSVTHVRYTANQAFPQCALYNQEGLPALPFIMEVASKVQIV